MSETDQTAGTERIGGELLAEMLAAEGVDTVFGIVDGTYLGFYTAFEKYAVRKSRFWSTLKKGENYNQFRKCG